MTTSDQNFASGLSVANKKSKRSHLCESWCKLVQKATIEILYLKLTLCSEIWVIMIHITNFTISCTKSLDGRVVIAFRSNLPWFCEIWAVMGSIPPSGTWFFFFVQIHYYTLFIYACISYNDKKQSKLLSNLLKITINFWTVWASPQRDNHYVPKDIRMCFFFLLSLKKVDSKNMILPHII